MIGTLLAAICFLYGTYGILTRLIRPSAVLEATIVDLKQTRSSFEPIVRYEYQGQQYTGIGDAGLRRITLEDLEKPLKVTVFKDKPEKIAMPLYIYIGFFAVGLFIGLALLLSR